MDSSCLVSGFSYLLASGMAIAAIVLSSWLVQLYRAVYREEDGVRSGLANATPGWVAALTGVGALFVSWNWLRDWVDTCVSASRWSAPGALLIGLGLVVAMTAVVRLVYGRVRVGSVQEPSDSGDENSSQHSPADAATPAEHAPKLPLERRRVMVEFALTYGVAVIVAIIGVGLQ